MCAVTVIWLELAYSWETFSLTHSNANQTTHAITPSVEVAYYGPNKKSRRPRPTDMIRITSYVDLRVHPGRTDVLRIVYAIRWFCLLRRHWSLSFTHKLSRVSKSLTALFGLRHLTYGTNFLHLFAFLVSRPPQSAVLHSQAPTLLLNRWLACLMGSSILVLKLTFFHILSPVTFLSLTDWFHGFYPTRVQKSLALKTLVSAAD